MNDLNPATAITYCARQSPAAPAAARQALRAWAVVMGALLIAAGLAGCGEDDNPAEPSPVGVTERQWRTEDEFLHDPSLLAGVNEVVLLHLRAGAQGTRQLHVIPYLFEYTASYNFCIPAEEPYIESMDLLPEDSVMPVVHVERGAGCETETIMAGRYRLIVAHESADLDPAGVTAFIHIPRVPLEAGLESAPGDWLNSLPACASPFPTASFWTSINNPMYTLAVSGGYLPAVQHPSTRTSYQLVTTGSVQNSLNAWSLCKTGSGSGVGVAFFNGVNTSEVRNWLPVTAGNPNTLNDSYPACSGGTAPCFVKLADLGNSQFTLSATGNDLQIHPVVTNAGALILGPIGNPAAVFTALYRSYRQNAAVPALQTGEVAIVNAGCGQSAVATYIGSTSLPNLKEAGISGFSSLIVRPGPGTVAVAYPSVNYAGTPNYIFQDTCLNGLPASLAVMPITRDFVVASKTCKGCDLSGINLDNVDLHGGDFTATVFNGGSLVKTNFQAAIMDQAHFDSTAAAPTVLTSTDFLNARLYNTTFNGSELRDARFWTDITPPVVPFIKRDFTDRTQLQNASLDGNTFPIKDWHYLVLDGAVIHGVSGQTLSGTGNPSPLDLSQARLRGTQGLTKIDLTAATLSGADFTGTDLTGVILESVTASASTPAVFNKATLTNASLKSATLSGSFFRGAQLNPANLGSADLSGAWMEDDQSNQYGRTVLSGAYMMNTKLNNAHLTKAGLDNVSWYNENPAAVVATAANALLTNASFNLAALPGLDLTGAHLNSATLTNTQLISANFTNADLTDADFSQADLAGANLTSTNLTGADLQNAFVDALPASEIYIKVLVDPGHYQSPPAYQYFAVDRPATIDSGATVTTLATCPNSAKGPCGPIRCTAADQSAITCASWVAVSPPLEPANCTPTPDSQGNVVGLYCPSTRKPAPTPTPKPGSGIVRAPGAS